MVLQSITDLDDDVYPGVQEYARCQSKAFLKGFIGFVAGGAAGLTASIYARQRYAARFTPSHTVSAIAGGAIVFGYLAASIASRDCQKNWVRMAQAAGYNDDVVTPHRTVTEQLGEPQAQGNTSSAIASRGGQDEVDGSVSMKTKYGDTMD
ncbi:transmembrane protein 141 [Strongylocentrotus purpuratus]|uniref:Uncharacterized protein n=1 Tax=Strongylocentrotus purpuratus TaxID=7668 RepID=A0A7M7RHH4_STRPU|nr:transmembrane protein 141 [Strongylocentrotus purpuratus]|eukprot:XP_798416.1 PREDICTED: transmembrane protein 141 [Strongylocentrotus purpuratus]